MLSHRNGPQPSPPGTRAGLGATRPGTAAGLETHRQPTSGAGHPRREGSAQPLTLGGTTTGGTTTSTSNHQPRRTAPGQNATFFGPLLVECRVDGSQLDTRKPVADQPRTRRMVLLRPGRRAHSALSHCFGTAPSRRSRNRSGPMYHLHTSHRGGRTCSNGRVLWGTCRFWAAPLQHTTRRPAFVGSLPAVSTCTR